MKRISHNCQPRIPFEKQTAMIFSKK